MNSELNRKIKYLITAILTICLSASVISGCGKKEEKTDVVLTTAFEDNELFRIDDKNCLMEEAGVYMRSAGSRYQDVFGEEIWKQNFNGKTLENELKDTTLARLAQIKSMDILADEWDISLSDEEIEKTKEAASVYYDLMSDEEKRYMGVTEELLQKMYAEYALADKIYKEVTRNVKPEISDDEARSITVKQILFKTSSLDEKGNRKEYSEHDKKDAYKRASDCLEQARNGADFDSLTEKYNEDDQNTYTFGKGVMPEEFEKAAFNLDTDEISNIVETGYGYHIIKCISSFDQEETDANKERIVTERKKEAFNRVYDEFVPKLHSNLNEELWKSFDYDPS
ncbi:MAG: peptidylprolyl isomerase, partial [Lachnospiraceae bacterium]|nr:peptidylprolyl isomerase [Lachnospiraceae bacterium]